MKILLFALLPTLATATTLNPAPFPVFLKAGFSSVVEFDEIPTRVVLGDGHNFQVEKLDHSLVIKTLAPYATTNMFVYFKEQNPRLFVLNASEDAEPTYFKRFEIQKIKLPDSSTTSNGMIIGKKSCRLISSDFDSKKDYLTVNIEIAADSSGPVQPTWSLVRLKYGKTTLIPMKLWSERKDVQRDSRVRARFIFAKPNVPRDLKGVALVVPVSNGGQAFSVALKRGQP